MDATRERDRRALADLAKLAASSTPAPPSQRPMLPPKPNPDSSGLIDLQAMMASQPGWLEDAVARAKVRPPPPSSLAPVIAPFSAPRIDTMETLAPPPKSKVGYVLATGIALLAIGAACAFGWRVHKDNLAALAKLQASMVAAAPAPVDAPAIPAPVATAATAAEARGAIAAPAPAGAAPAATPAATPGAAGPQAATAVAAATPDDDEPVTTKGKRHGKHGKGRHAAAAAADPTPAPAAAPEANDGSIFARAAGVSAPAAPPAAPVAAAAPAPKASKLPHDNSPLGAALREAAGGGDMSIPKVAGASPVADPAPAAKRAAPVDGRPDRPSPSAVTSALQAQVPSARTCVASASGASRVRVTFASEGNVTGVDVSGAAESDPAMVKCLKSAMGKAHVPAFGQPSYSAAVNVRP